MRTASPISLGLAVFLCGCPVITQDMVTEKVGSIGEPAISLSPTTATTTDDLVVSIVTEAVVENGTTPTYHYQWLVDGLLRDDLTDSTLPASETSKNQTWTMTATY